MLIMLPFKKSTVSLLLAGLLPICTEVQANNDADQATDIERITVVKKRSSIFSEITENTEKLVDMPGALGDPLQAAFALPGVVSAGGSMSEPAVRGSAPSDNYFEVDFMPAGYIFHDFGNSIFNKNIVREFNLYSAGYGTGFSDATGAVFDVTLRNPRQQAIKTTLDLTMFNAGVFVEGAITEDLAFYVSGRKSTLPIFFSEGEELEDDDGEPTGVIIDKAPDDHDYQGKLVWDINANNMLSLSVTGAQDSAKASFSQRAELSLKNPEYAGQAEFDRAFNSQSIVWDHFASNYQLKLGIGLLEHSGRLTYGRGGESLSGYFEDEKEQQTTYKGRLNYQISPQQSLTLDAAYFDKAITYRFDTFLYVCTEIDPDCDLTKRERIEGQNKADVDSYFVGANYTAMLTESLQSDVGVQYQKNDYSDEHFIHPRLTLTYFLSPDDSMWVKYGEYNRLQDIDVIMPDVGNPKLKSQTSQQSVIGFGQYLADDWNWSVEGYYKTMSDLPLALGEEHPNAQQLYSNDVEGRAYGIELLVNKNKSDNWYGWMSLSYAKSERTDLQRNITRDYYADTPIVFNAVYHYEFNERWSGGFNFTARSGQAYTPIVGVVENDEFEGKFQPQYGEPFSERFDLYHRLDVRFERKTDFFGLDALLIFEVMNLYAQENTASIDLDYQKTTSTQEVILQEESDDFSMRPSIGFSFTF